MSGTTTEHFPGGLTYVSGPGAFPLSTDTMALAHFASVGPRARIADLGSGSGALGLLLLGQHPDCTVTGLELQPDSHAAALANIARNHLAERMQSVLADVKEARSLFAPGSFTAVVTNPPYFPAGPGSSAFRKELNGSLADFFAAADWLLRFGGDLFLVHRPERLTDLLFLARSNRLEPKELCLLRHDALHTPSLVLLRCRKGGRPGLKLLPELVLRHPDGSPTDDYRHIYHLD